MPGNIRGRFCQIKPSSLLEKRITGLVDKADCVDIIHLDFSKAFDLAPYDILVKNLALYGINRAHVKWLKN